MASDPASEAVKPLQPHNRRYEWLFALALLFLTLIAYYPAWFGKPIWDDDAHITAPELRSWPGLLKIWTEPGATHQYYPLVHSVLWMEYRIWGGATLGYHLVNTLLHVLCALLLLRILRLLEIPGAWLAAAIFALHPIEVESVAWISEIKNTLSEAFYLGAALVYLRFDRNRERHHYFIALMLFLPGLFCKTVISTLPAALLVVFWWKRGKLSWKRDVKPLIPFFVPGVAMGLVTAYVEKKYIIGGESGSFHFTVAERCVIAGRAFWFYIGKLLWPAKLTFIYPRWDLNRGDWRHYLFPAASLVLLAALWMLRKRTRTPLAALLFFGGTLFPALGFVNIYPFIYSFVADHFQYAAGIGPIALVSAGIATLAESRQKIRNAVYAGATIIVLALAALTWKQCHIYRDAEALWRDTLAKNPGSIWMARNNLGLVLLENGRLDEAMGDFEKTLELKPDAAEACDNIGVVLLRKGEVDAAVGYFNKALDINPYLPEAHGNLANALFKKGDVENAMRHYQFALKVDPHLADANENFGTALLKTGRVDEAIRYLEKAALIKPRSADSHYNLANALLQSGNAGDAILHYQKALEIDPAFAEAHDNLGAVLLQEGRLDEAIGHFQKAIELKSGSAEAHYNFAGALLQKGDADDAILQYQKALEIKPDYAEAQYSLGTVFLQIGRVEEAIGHFQKAVQFKSNYAQAHYNLAVALTKTGRTEEAISQYRRALEIQPGYPKAQNGLAHVLAACPRDSLRNGGQALELAQQANQSTGGSNPIVLRTLAETYAECGQYKLAVETAQRALELANAQSDAPLAEQLRSQIPLYQARKPFRDQSLGK